MFIPNNGSLYKEKPFSSVVDGNGGEGDVLFSDGLGPPNKFSNRPEALLVVILVEKTKQERNSNKLKK